MPQFTWTGVTGATRYEIYIADLAGGVVDQTVTGTTFTPATPLLSGHNCRWWVRAAGAGWSTPLDFSIALPTLTAPSGSLNTVLPQFTWTGVAGVTKYEIYVADLAGGIQDLTITGTSWTPTTPLLSGHSYRWWVRAVGAGWSNSLDFAVALPTLIAPNATAAVSAVFTWTGIAGVAKYEVYVSDLDAGTIQDQTVIGTTWTPPSPLISGHKYRWWVRALNADGGAGSWTGSVDFSVA